MSIYELIITIVTALLITPICMAAWEFCEFMKLHRQKNKILAKNNKIKDRALYFYKILQFSEIDPLIDLLDLQRIIDSEDNTIKTNVHLTDIIELLITKYGLEKITNIEQLGIYANKEILERRLKQM